MMYIAENGYGLKLTKFNEQYEDCIIYRSTKEKIIMLADNIIRSFDRKGLMNELNDMQKFDYPLFENKFTIPSYFINLLLEKHNMKVLGW